MKNVIDVQVDNQKFDERKSSGSALLTNAKCGINISVEPYSINRMDIDHAREIAQRLLIEHGLIDWQIKLNTNKRRLGICKEYIKQIELSRLYVERNEIEHVRDTILHEIAHGLVGARHGHDSVWKEMCVRLGCTPRACEDEADMPDGDWHAKCPSCRKVFTMHRKPKSVRGRYCVACGPDHGRLNFSNIKISYRKRVERASETDTVQLMLKIF